MNIYISYNCHQELTPDSNDIKSTVVDVDNVIATEFQMLQVLVIAAAANV